MNRKAEIATELFGGNLTEQGRGPYVALELLALIRSCLDFGGQVLPRPEAGDMRLALRSHDFARRLAGDLEGAAAEGSVLSIGEELASTAFDRPETRQIVSALVESLVMPVPGRRKAPTFKQRALYPYIGELIHYDAVDRRNRILLERYTSRGAGGLAHHLLRTDPEAGRLERMRAGFALLVGDSGSNLGNIMEALRANDVAEPKRDWVDGEEAKKRGSEVVGATWAEQLRAGTDRILRTDVPTARRVDRLMHWVPYCIARLQGELADREIGEPDRPIPADLGSQPSALRSEARHAFDTRMTTIYEAMSHRARANAAAAGSEEARLELEKLAEGRPWKQWVTFHAQTLASCGALNALSGPRHYTFRLGFLEALIGATIEPGHEVPFEDFCQMVYGRYGLVVDRRAADTAGLLGRINAREFEENRRSLLARVRDLGLLAEFSDQTQLVRSVAA